MQKLSFTREEMEADLERYKLHWQERGFGLRAAEEKGIWPQIHDPKLDLDLLLHVRERND